jgi:hypothetical protein
MLIIRDSNTGLFKKFDANYESSCEKINKSTLEFFFFWILHLMTLIIDSYSSKNFANAQSSD